jgi:ATP-binding cassette subfamily B protein
VAYDELDLRHLRRRLGFVPQDPVVFAGSVLENIAYGAAEVDMERVERAAATAGADEFIGRLAKGYETLVGEGGALLSGGQRQRIGLARALYHEPTLLLLDEPTNQLDERLAGRLLRNLRELPSRPGLLIVSHEIERVVGHADDFFELREGRLVAAPRADGQPAREREAVA